MHPKIPHPKNYNVRRPLLKRLISLMLWAKGLNITGETIQLPTGIMRVQILKKKVRVHKGKLM